MPQKLNFEQLVAKKRQEVLSGRDFWEPRVADSQVDGLAQVLARRQLRQAIPAALQPAENLRQQLRRRSFC